MEGEQATNAIAYLESQLAIGRIVTLSKDADQDVGNCAPPELGAYNVTLDSRFTDGVLSGAGLSLIDAIKDLHDKRKK